MAAWRDMKAKGLGDIHRTFQIPAVYLTHTAGTPVRVNVRLHQAPRVSQVQAEAWADAGRLLDESDNIVFDLAELSTILPKAYVIFGNSEAYLTGPSRPARDGYQIVDVTVVSQADLTTLLAAVDTTGATWAGVLT